MHAHDLMALFGAIAGIIVSEEIDDRASMKGLKILLRDGGSIHYNFPDTATREERIAAHNRWRVFLQEVQRKSGLGTTGDGAISRIQISG
jgi:hypothetical protein